MKKLIFVTGNKDKAKEAQEILGFPIEVVQIEIEEIQDLDIEKVVLRKAQDAFAIIKKPLIVEDVGVYVKAWNGFPGPFIKFLHLAGKGNYELLIRMLKGEEDRGVEVKAVIGYHDGKKVHVIEGAFTGKIVERKGEKGWGFDPYIIPDDFRETFGELDEKIKNKISHRAKALMKLKKFLDRKKA